jgi:hypothetical protein
MKVFKYILIMIVFSLLSLVSYMYYADVDYSVDIQEIQIANKVKSFLPYKTSTEVVMPVVNNKFNVDIHINTAKIDFLESGEIQLLSSFIVYKKDSYVTGEITAKSGIKYINGDFYLDNIEVVDLITGELQFSREDKQKINNVKSGLSLFLNIAKQKFGENVPDVKDIENKLKNKYMVDKDGVLEGIKLKVKDKMIEFSKKRPIYTIQKDTYKNKLARLAVDDVIIKENVLTVKINSSTFVKNLLKNK